MTQTKMNGQQLPPGLSEQEREDLLTAAEFITVQMDLYNKYLYHPHPSVWIPTKSWMRSTDLLYHISAGCLVGVGTSAFRTTGIGISRWARAHA